jgi:hypothetical protein
MANGNPYAPLYDSVQARGTLAPLGAPGAIKPEKKKKGLSDKMASALGSMMDQGMLGDDKKRISQLTLRNNQLIDEEKKWVGTQKWNQENYEWEAFGVEHSGHKREKEYYSNLEEIKQLELDPLMSDFDKPLSEKSKTSDNLMGSMISNLILG